METNPVEKEIRGAPFAEIHLTTVVTEDGTHSDASVEMYEDWTLVHTSREDPSTDPHIWIPNKKIKHIEGA